MIKLIIIFGFVWGVSGGGSGGVGGGSGGGGSGGFGDGGLSDQVLADIVSAMAREAIRDIKDDETSLLHRWIIILGVVANLIVAILFKFIFLNKKRLISK